MNLDQFEKKVNKKDIKFGRDLKYEIGTLVTLERIQSGFSQEELAKRIKTQQPGIARVESGRTLPSLSFLEKIANAMSMYVDVRFTSMHELVKKDSNSELNSGSGLIKAYYSVANMTLMESSS